MGKNTESFVKFLRFYNVSMLPFLTRKVPLQQKTLVMVGDAPQFKKIKKSKELHILM